MKKYIFPIIFIILFLTASVWLVINSQQNVNADNLSNTTQTVTPTNTQTQSTTSAPTTTVAPTTPLIFSKISNLDKWIFFPVDKKTPLASDFVPSNLVNLSSNGINAVSTDLQMRKEVIADLKELQDDAKKNGVSLKVLSPYRSYNTQVTTFNYWKSLELQKGLSDAQATVEANKSSAFPGQSEHQLGTTCDVISTSDSTLDETASNKKMWNWLKDNLIKHGFVLSFPDGKDDKTGYVYEPWHIRWVGKDVAQEIANTDYINPANSNTSTSYLRTIWEKIK